MNKPFHISLFGCRGVRLIFLSGLVCAFNGESLARKTARVYVDSFATEAYTERRESEDGLKRETYHMSKGRFFRGSYRDRGLQNIEFDQIVETLAVDLKVRNYHPAPTVEEGDLLIMVHWGVTTVEDDVVELLDLDTNDEQAMRDFGAYDSPRTFEGQASSKMLGFGRALRKKGLSLNEEHDIRFAMEDERYFIILMAFDWQKLRNEKEVELLWSTRFSLRSIGTNFQASYPALSRAAQGYFGSNLDVITKSDTHFGEGDIEFGELEVVETVSEASESEKTE